MSAAQLLVIVFLAGVAVGYGLEILARPAIATLAWRIYQRRRLQRIRGRR